MSAVRSYKGIFPFIGQQVYIDPSSVLVGDIHLEEDVSIWPMVVARGDVNSIKIGARTNIQDGTVLHVTHKSESNPDGYPLNIGRDVTIGHKAMLHGCIIGDRVLVGMGALILDNAIIENDVMIGAGSLVPSNKKLESGYLYIGTPVKKIRPLTADEINFLSYSSAHYVKLKNNYLSENS